MAAPKIIYRLLGPDSYDDDLEEFRDGYAIERVETTVVASFATREEAYEWVLEHRPEP